MEMMIEGVVIPYGVGLDVWNGLRGGLFF